MRYVSDRVGAEHVALGSDFDGAVTEPFDATGLVEITDRLLASGYSEEQIRMMMGGNVIRFLQANLP
jgi:microsomal dipeptidase-like Zn-dependent dipeptidase